MSEAQYVVVFSSELAAGVAAQYELTAQQMVKLAQSQPGFVRMDSLRADGKGITVSYWDSLAAVNKWKWDAEHLAAQKLGREKYYKTFQITVARIEKEVEFTGHGR